MIGKDLLDMFRCPVDPTRTTRLDQEADGLVCQRCRVKFPVKDGIPCMLVEEAQLPPGSAGLQSLPCQQTGVPQEARG